MLSTIYVWILTDCRLCSISFGEQLAMTEQGDIKLSSVSQLIFDSLDPQFLKVKHYQDSMQILNSLNPHVECTD